MELKLKNSIAQLITAVGKGEDELDAMQVDKNKQVKTMLEGIIKDE